MNSKDILEHFKYPVYGSDGCNEPLATCPGNYECWNFDHHINEIKNFMAWRRRLRYENSVCRKCFFIMYIDLARIVYMSRKALDYDFLKAAYGLHHDLYNHFVRSKNPSSPFRSHFFYIVFDEVRKFIQAHDYIQYGFAIEVNVLYSNLVDCWMTCSPSRPCDDHLVD